MLRYKASVRIAQEPAAVVVLGQLKAQCSLRFITHIICNSFFKLLGGCTRATTPATSHPLSGGAPTTAPKYPMRAGWFGAYLCPTRSRFYICCRTFPHPSFVRPLFKRCKVVTLWRAPADNNRKQCARKGIAHAPALLAVCTTCQARMPDALHPTPLHALTGVA